MDEMERQNQDSHSLEAKAEAPTPQAPPQRVTLEDVRQAIEALGLTPAEASAGRIREYPGRGSKETIQRHLHALREEEQIKETRGILGKLVKLIEPTLESLVAVAEREARRYYDQALEEHQEVLQEAKREIEKLRKALEEAGHREREIEARMDELRRTNKELTDRLAATEGDLRWERHKAETLRGDLERERAASGALREQVQVLVEQLSSLKAELEKAKTELEKTKEELAKTKEEATAEAEEVGKEAPEAPAQSQPEEELSLLFGQEGGRKKPRRGQAE